MGVTILKKNERNHYWPISRSCFESQILVDFLTDSYDGKYTRKWFSDNECIWLEKNQILLDKKDNKISFSDIFDTEGDKFEFAITRDTFLKMLDQWEAALAAKKEYIVVEVFDDNDVVVYSLDDIEGRNFPKNEHPVYIDDLVNEDQLEKYLLETLEREGMAGTYELLIKGSYGPFPKTFFPSDWTRKKVMEKIIEAYEYAAQHKLIKILKNKNVEVLGFTKEGIEVRMFINHKATVETAFPILKVVNEKKSFMRSLLGL